MSTKISKGARLHLLRVVERLEFPMRVIRVGRAPMNEQIREALATMATGMQAFVLPASCEFEIVEPGRWRVHNPGGSIVIGGHCVPVRELGKQFHFTSFAESDARLRR